MPIARVRGRVEDAGDDWLIVSVGGLGVLLSTPSSVADGAGAGTEIALFTHLHVREDALTLYGFGSREQLQLFERLISVSGVGPRVALGLLSAMDAPQLAAAIVGGRSDALRKVPGVGQKTAERIVLDLRDKVAALAAVDADVAAPGSAESTDEVDRDVVAALLALGYSQQEATSAAEAVTADDASLEDKVRAALAQFARP